MRQFLDTFIRTIFTTVVTFQAVDVTLHAQPLHEVTRVIASGPNDRPNYRIPAVVQAYNGDLLVFVEKRHLGIGDLNDTDICMFRSTDRGKTWQDERLLLDEGFFTHTDITVYSDPDRDHILLLFLYDKKQFQLMESSDSGLTWTAPVSIHKQVIPAEWDSMRGSTNPHPGEPHAGQRKGEQWEAGWFQRYGIGPGSAIARINEGPHAGRLVVPARVSLPMEGMAKTITHTFVIFSDDDGKTWQRGGTAIPFGNEAQLVALAGGRLMINARDGDSRSRPDKLRRRIAVSEDGGETWNTWQDTHLLTPQCHGALERFTFGGQDLLLFTNPRSGHRTPKYPYGRTNLSIQISRDNGQTWPSSRNLYVGPGSYTDMVVLDDGTVGVVYECGDPGTDHYWSYLDFARFDINWVGEDGR